MNVPPGFWLTIRQCATMTEPVRLGLTLTSHRPHPVAYS